MSRMLFSCSRRSPSVRGPRKPLRREARQCLFAAKGWRKSSARKLQEYAEEYRHLGIAAPRWFRAWRRFAYWLVDCKTEKPSEDVRLSFGYPVTGIDCNELTHRTSRLIFLRKGGYYLKDRRLAGRGRAARISRGSGGRCVATARMHD